MEVAVSSFGEALCLVVVQTFTSSTQVQSTGRVIVTRFFFHMCASFRGAMGLQFLFMDDNVPCHRTVAAEQLLESRRLAARTLPSVTIRELRLVLQDEWAAMPQQIDTLILSIGRRCETCLAGCLRYTVRSWVGGLAQIHHAAAQTIFATRSILESTVVAYKILFSALQQKRSILLNSEEHGGQITGPPLPIYRCLNT
ncbi:hypothetical protein TNCV_907011 [Trichonephila clavipes]|nr:hypothetical protein TNCV_907011 [Trichonephila clavipes]